MPRRAAQYQGLALSLSTDPSSLASIDAVEKALLFYAQSVAHAPGAPFGATRAEELSVALRAGSPCDPNLFDDLVTFGRLMHRLATRPGVPACNIGDVLVAVARLPPVGIVEPWERDPMLDETTFAKLGFAATSKGIADAEDNNRDAWRSHTERCRTFIDAAADLPRTKRNAMVLGVGHAFDVPLASLAQSFDNLILVDIDAEALASAANALLRTEPRAHLETRVMDLTGINRTMVSTLDRLLGGSKERETVQKRIEEYVRSYRIEPIQLLPTGERADLLVSSCVVSQLAWPQRAYALTRLQTLGPVAGEAERSWGRAWFELELRVQQDHIRACTEAAQVVVLISDVVNRHTARDAAGLERPTGQKTFTLGVDSLLERIPQTLRVERHGSWLWPRYRPGPSGETGSSTEVEAVVLYDRLKAIA